MLSLIHYARVLAFTPLALMGIHTANHPVKQNITEPVPQVAGKKAPKIQVAVLLDVSGSMNGLIDQAKTQLWNIVSTMGRARCNEAVPQIEIALYEYGRTDNDATKGYVKQINPFSNDLDQVSKNLFALTTNGGDEYCGQVIYTSLNELQWDAAKESYKVIFIAGNEDFLQGNIQYSQACAEANKKGVIVNTIYCGDRMQGIREHWNLAGECGNGSFTTINHNARVPDIPTPYDSTLISLNSRLNGTYIAYNDLGVANFARQGEVDRMNEKAGAGVAAQRAAVKADAKLYYNGSWDLVDAQRNDSSFIAKVDIKSLPENLRNKSRAELQQLVKQKNEERSLIQKEIVTVNGQREKYINEQHAKTSGNKEQTLGSEVQKIVTEQAKRHNMIIQ